MTPATFTVLFLCAAALSLVSAAAGGFFALWVTHVAKTGVSPLPSLPALPFRRKRDQEDDTPARPTRERPVGP